MCWGLVRVGGRRRVWLWWMWVVQRFVTLVMMYEAVIASGSEAVIECFVGCFEMAFERSPIVLMVSLMLDLFVRTLAAAPKAVIAASCVCFSTTCSSLVARKQWVEFVDSYRVITPLPDNDSNISSSSDREIYRGEERDKRPNFIFLQKNRLLF